jgi:4-hydroxy-2-oxoheptanedioate aldolase
MTGRQLIEALRGGRRVYGTLIVSPSPRWPTVVKGMGLDFVFLDTEHAAIDRHDLSWMCRTYAAMGLPPVVRIPSPDPYQAAMVLDGGAAGVIAPYVESADEVRRLAGAVKYRPVKGERLRAKLAGAADFEPQLADYLSQRAGRSVLIVNIESTPAIANLDDILAVPELDAVLIGPHDLSCSLGIPEQYRHERFESAVREIIARARARGVGAGIHFSGEIDQQIAWAKAGMNLIVHSSDLRAFERGIGADLAAIRNALGDGRHAGETNGDRV